MLQRLSNRLARRAVAVLTLPPLLLLGMVATASAWQNKPPVIYGKPATSGTVGERYAFRPIARDPEGRTLTFKVANLPAWASFNTSTGRISGMPSRSGRFSSIRISVSDGRSTASLAPFSITVVRDPATNRVPVIEGTAATVIEADTPYAFKVTASDADGDKLTYSISGMPAWAAFDRSTGTLYGTPAAVDVGTYSNIVISVSDGIASRALAAYSLTVAPVANRTVTVKWLTPTQNTDGTTVTNLSGYMVFYGTSSHQYSTSMYLPGAATNSVVVEGLSPGTYYFSVKAVNNAGVESAYANEVVALL